MPFTQLNTDFGGKFTAAAGAAVGDDIAKALQRYEEDKKKHDFNQGVFDVLKDQTDSDGNSYISPDALSRWNSINPDKQAGILAAAGARIQEDQKKKIAQIPYSFQPTQEDFDHARAAGGELIATGKGQYHFVPYPDASAEGDQLNLSPEDQANYDKAGKIPVRTTKKSFQVVDMPDVSAPDVDASGNPIYSPDGAMYRSGGKYKPVTAPMAQARMMFESLQKNNKPVADAMASQPGFSIFHPSTWLGSQTNPTPAATPVGNSAGGTPAATSGGAAPGSKVRVKHPNGQIGLIPVEQLPAAIAQGYQPVQ